MKSHQPQKKKKTTPPLPTNDLQDDANDAHMGGDWCILQHSFASKEFCSRLIPLTFLSLSFNIIIFSSFFSCAWDRFSSWVVIYIEIITMRKKIESICLRRGKVISTVYSNTTFNKNENGDITYKKSRISPDIAFWKSSTHYGLRSLRIRRVRITFLLSDKV